MPARTYKSTFIIIKFEKILLKTTAPLAFIFLPAGKQTHTYTCLQLDICFLVIRNLITVTLIGHNIMTTCLILFWSPYCCQNRHGKMLATDTWSPVYYKVGPPWIRLVCPAHPRDARLRSGESGSSNSLYSSNYSWTIFALWSTPQSSKNTVSKKCVCGLQQCLDRRYVSK